MSVYKSKRSTSAIQYVENARQLQVFTIKNCVKFPKRYTYIVVQKIANLGEDIDTHVRVAESMMPTNLHEAQLKRDELTYTFGLLNSLDDKLQLVYDIVSDNPNFKMEFNLKYCMEEIRKKCKEYGFVLNEKKTKMALLRKGVKFLKTKFFPE